MLKVSYSQRAALRLSWDQRTLRASCSQGRLKASYSQCRLLRVLFSAPPTESMILSAPSADTTNKTWARSIVNALCLKVFNKCIVKAMIFSSFNDIDLLHNMLANCWMGQCRGEGTMVAIGQWWPPWLGCVFFASFRLANRMSDVPQPQNHTKTNYCLTSYLR